MAGVVAVHCGAGSHNNQLFPNYKKLCNKSCKIAREILLKGGSALEAVKAAIVVLEDDPLTNCGYGSNLTLNGIVENDASIMDGNTLKFGACGAVNQVKNPIKLAHSLCVKQSEKLPLGLIPPSLLVGEGALEFAKTIDLEVVESGALVSKKALRQFNKYKKLLDTYITEQLLDTVGAVCIDCNGNVAAACSSGGIILKKPGRVGQAAIFASGCWADSTDDGKESAVGVCTTGCGEHLIQTQLAKEIANDLKFTTCLTEDLHKTMTEKFLKSKFLKNVDSKMGGALVLHKDSSTKDVVILWTHSTETMIVGYMGTEDRKPKCEMSILPNNVKPGTKSIVGGSKFYTINKIPSVT